MSSGASIAVLQQAEVASGAETALAARLGMMLCTEAKLHSSDCPDYVMETGNEGISLRGLQPGNRASLKVDFSSGRLRWRNRQSLKSQLLGKAVGINRHAGMRILDATAGLGTDGFLLAMAGCEVNMLERSPIVFALLQDGLQRARLISGAIQDAAARISLQQADFLRYEAAGRYFDVVYLDPMFSPGIDRARAGKSRFFLQQLLPECAPEAAESIESDRSGLTRMLAHARKMVRRRVVLKRARLAPTADIPKPDIQFRGSSCRFDVFLAQ